MGEHWKGNIYIANASNTVSNSKIQPKTSRNKNGDELQSSFFPMLANLSDDMSLEKDMSFRSNFNTLSS